MKLPQPLAVVIGLDDGTTGIQTARILHRRGVDVIALAKNRRHYCCWTNTCREIIFTDTDSEQLIDDLIEIGKPRDDRPVLFPCQDHNVALVSRFRNRLEPFFRIILPPDEVVAMLQDKAQFYTFAENERLPIPKTFLIRNEDDIARATRNLRYPCILKPAIRSPEWNRHTNYKAFKLASPEELRSHCRRYGSVADTLIAQDWIAGADTDHYSCNCYFEKNGNPTAAFTIRKLRQWPQGTGQGCLGIQCTNGEVNRITFEVFRRVPFHGLAYLELKQDSRTGEYLIIEPNIGRPTGRSATADAAGVELIYTMYCDAIGRELPGIEPKTTTMKWIHWRRDLQAAACQWLSKQITLREWWQSWRGPKASAIFSWRDPLPFVVDMLHAVVRVVSPSERSRRQDSPRKNMSKLKAASTQRGSKC